MYAGHKDDVFGGAKAHQLAKHIDEALAECPKGSELLAAGCSPADLILVLDTLAESEEHFEAELELAVDLVHSIPALDFGVGAGALH